MLAELQQIVQRVNAAANLHEAPEIIVHRVKAAMEYLRSYLHDAGFFPSVVFLFVF